MMRRACIAAIFLAVAPVAYCSDGARITEIGVKGYYYQDYPTRVEVMLLHPDPRPTTVELRVRVHSFPALHIERVDTFAKRVMVTPNDRQIVDVPVLLQFSDKATVQVQEIDADGNVLSEDIQSLEPPLAERLVAILCVQSGVCQQAQSQISFSGTASEQTDKGKTLKFVTIENPPEQAWEYSPVKAVVLARPVWEMTPAQRDALEGFTRQGGALIVLEDQARSASFLQAYHSSAFPGTPATVGRGKIFWVPTLASKVLGELYTGPRLPRAVQGGRAVGLGRDELSWARRRLATHFRFPTLTWLLAWLAAYILAAGVGNFALLRKLDRREWGWITLPCISLVFACAMYLSSALTRPHELRSEDIAVLWMDENSPVAFVQRGERISSNRRQTVQFRMSGDVVFEGDRNGTGTALSLDNFGGGTHDNPLNHWDVALGPPTNVELRMLQWSFRDLEFTKIAKQPGSVSRLDGARFRNETGKNFRQAMYVDNTNVYFLDAVPNGSEIDLSRVRKSALAKVANSRIFTVWGYPTEISEVGMEEMALTRASNASDASSDADAAKVAMGQREKPFELVELIRGWPSDGGHAFDARAGLFFGLADETEVPGSLPGKRFAAKGYSITIVSYERKP
jgi:hypothetical protein